MSTDPRGPIEVLLVDGNNRAGLSIARSLARHQISFLMVSDHRGGPALSSRAVEHAQFAPCPMAQVELFAGFLAQKIRQYGIRLAIPVTDQALLLFERGRPILEAECKLAMAGSQSVRGVLDKRRNLELASGVGVPCPRQFELEHPAQIPELIRELGFPMVLKRPGDPLDPKAPTLGFRVLHAHNEEELRRHIQENCASGEYPIFQECVTGEVHNLCCFVVSGEVEAAHEYHSIRRRGGVGVLRKIVAPRPDLLQHTRALLGALHWDGVAHVAFFVSRDGEKKWYMETNGRFWASVEGSVHAGWDFPYWVYRYFLHGERPAPGEIKVGSKTCWHCGDLAALLDYVRGGEPPATGTHPGKLRALGQYLTGFSPWIHSDVFRWSDPMPGMVEHWNLAAEAWELLKRRIAHSYTTSRLRQRSQRPTT